MHDQENRFDLVLSYPQWQGSGRPENLRLGAQTAAEVCGDFGPLLEVRDVGEGEERHGIHRWTAILDQFRDAQSLMAERKPRRILTAGGDCACDVAVIDYLHRQYPNLNVIWIDAHLDANTLETSPSGNFHGMPVAAIMGSAPADLLPLLASPLPPSRFRYASAHVGDDGERIFQEQHNLAWLEADELIDGPVHIHFDLDVLDPALFPHVAYPDGNLSTEDGLKLVRALTSSNDLVGLTITEFAPADQRSAIDGGSFIRQLCQVATSRGR